MYHMWDVWLLKIEPGLKMLFTIKILFAVAVTCTRLSLLSFYSRLLHRSGLHQYKWVIHCAWGFVIGLFLVHIGFNVFMCQ